MAKGKAVKAVTLLWLGSLFGAGLAFLTQVVVARSLGVELFGVFSSALTFVGILVPLACFGLPQFWLKVFGEEGWEGTRWLRVSLHFAMISTVCVFLAIILWALLGGNDENTKNLLLMLTAFVLGQASIELVSSKFQLEEKYFYLAVWQLLPHLMRFILIFVAMTILDESLYFYGIGGVYLVVGILFFALSFPHVANLVKGKIDLIGHDKQSKRLAAAHPNLKGVVLQSFPFGVAGAFHLIYFQGAIMLLAYLVGPSEAGIYNIAFLVMSAIYLFPNVIYQKFLLPKIHRWSNQNRELLYKSYKLGSAGMLGAGILASLCTWILAPYMVPILFGAEFEQSINVLCWLSLCAPLRFMATSVGSVLVTQDHMLRKIKCMALVAVISVLMSLLLIPKLSIYGALISAITSEALLLLLYFFSARVYVFNRKAK